MNTSEASLEKGMEAGLKQLMASMMETGVVDGLMLPVVQPDSRSVMPSLVTSAAGLEKAVLLSPAFFINTARMASRLSYKPSGRKTAVWMRPCEIRAFRELVKLNQASDEELVIMGMDCPMALDRDAWQAYADEHGAGSGAWAESVYPDPLASDFKFSRACRVCDDPFPDHADLKFYLYGRTSADGMAVAAGTPKGEKILAGVNIEPGQVPDEGIREKLLTAGKGNFEQMAEEITRATDSLDKLAVFFSACINCYNCRTVCPVCYCRECVFNTDVFSHEPLQYHQWAAKQGDLRLPSDTLFFHMTRLAHMSHACVGCGQCSRACPSDIPVADLFSVMGRHTQKAFDYHPGGEDPPPFTQFKADEFQDVVGIT